jgi:hypothetical protein
MDARAFNLRQSRLIVNTTPDVDSLAEVLPALRAAGVDDVLLAMIVEFLRELLALNHAEGELELQIAGWADELAIDLHTAQLAGEAKTLFGVKQTAALLRAPLGALADVDQDTFAAAGVVHHVLARSPRAQLLAPSLRHELGKGKFELLERLASQLQRDDQGATT